MNFTEGNLMYFERMMREPPCMDRMPMDAAEKDCKHCLYYNTYRKKCRLDKCIIFGD